VEALNLASLPKYLSDEASAWALLERLRWADGSPVCPHCGTKDSAHYFLTAKSGTRTTRMGNITYRRLWKCRNKECRKQFSVLVGTVFEASKVPVSKWLLAVYLMSAGKNGVSALELQRQLGLGSYQTAWFMAHRLREAMRREPVASLMSGTVVADETWVGGKPKNRHQQGKVRPKSGKGLAGTPKDKTPVMAPIEKGTGNVRARVMTEVTGPTLRKALTDHVDMANTVLHTDGHQGYRAIGREMAGHEYVDHGNHEYVRGDVSTNLAESFFAQYKRSLDGTFHNVSKHHLDRYTDEFEFRWNTRKLSDQRRVEAIIDGTAGKRLTYRPLSNGR
jgi:transposase-like protein